MQTGGVTTATAQIGHAMTVWGHCVSMGSQTMGGLPWYCAPCYATQARAQTPAGNFTYLETVQLVVDSDQPQLKIRVGLQPGAALPPQYGLFSRFVKDEYEPESVGPFPWGEELTVSVSAKAPVHMTLVPATTGAAIHDEQRAYAIFISVRLPAVPAGVEVHIHGDLPWESAQSEQTWAAANFDVSGCAASFMRPSWRWSGGTLGYFGTLARLQSCGETDVSIVMADGVTSSLPLSTSFVALRAEGGQELRAANSSVQSALEEFLRERLNGTRSWEDVSDPMLDTMVYWDDAQPRAAEFARKLRVSGYGRISGLRVVGKYGPRPPNPAQPARLAQFLEMVEYSILSGLLDLASSYVTDTDEDPAVDIAGVAVAHGPRRSKGAIQANSAYMPGGATV
jgi:hypothetical protein